MDETVAEPVQLSILVVNWNVRDLIRACLQSVRTQMLLSPQQYELIVLDNDSKDGFNLEDYLKDAVS